MMVIEADTGRAAPAVTRSSLVERLRGVCDHASWEEFFDQYWQLIWHVAQRAGLSGPDAEDVVQDTVVEVVGSLEGFRRERPGSFRSWLCAITRTKIAGVYRKRDQLRRKLDAYESEVDIRFGDNQQNDLEQVWNEEWQRNLLRAALERVKRQVSPRQFQIFQCHVLQEWSVAEVCEHLDVSAGMVYVTKHRVNAALKREVQNLQEES